jgi:hypothetical protein
MCCARGENLLKTLAFFCFFCCLFTISSFASSFFRSYPHTESLFFFFFFFFLVLLLRANHFILLLRYTHLIPTMDQANCELIDAGTRTNNLMCKCGRRSHILTTFTLPNFGKMFYTCGNSKIFFCIFSRNPILDLIFSRNYGLFYLILVFDSIGYDMVFSWVFVEICLITWVFEVGIC